MLVTEYFPPVTGGAARWFDVVVKNAQRFSWTIVTMPVEGAPEREEIGPHTVLRPAWWHVERSWFKTDAARAYSRLLTYLSELIRRDKPEVIHAMPAYGAAYAASIAARRFRVPLVTHVFGEEFGMQGRALHRRFLMRRSFSRSARVAAISEHTRAQSLRFGAREEQVEILIAADLSRLAPTDRAESRRLLGMSGDPLLLTVSRVVERKGHDQVIRAVARLKESFPSLRYYIAGTGPDKPRLEKLILDLDCTRHVSFLGLVPETNLAALYSAADLFVMPNRELASGEIEGFGLVFIESGACGVPSIGGRSGGSASAIVDGETGLLVEPLDTEALTAAIERMLRDHEFRRQCGERAQAFARQTFDPRAVVERLETLHREP